MKKRTVVIAVVVLIGITACVMGVLIRSEAQKRARYEQAMRLADAGDTGGAYVLFAQLGNYRDAALQAERMIEQDVLLPCRAAEKGDTVTFGRYEQDNNPGNGPEPIDWIVLDKVDGKLLLLSSACLAGKSYNAESFEPVTWETCSLRAWLGGEFFDSAFSEREREAVASVVNRNDDHSTVGTPGGKDMEDRVFLLSESDAVIYLNNDYDQDTIGRAMASDYAVANGLQTDEDGLCSWWLRSPGMYEYIAQFVDQKGKPYPNGGSTDIDYLVRRPSCPMARSRHSRRRSGGTMKALSMNVIPFRNMRAHPVRTVILLLLVLAQAVCAYGGLTLMRNMRQALSLADARLGADILVYPGAAMSKISADSLLMQGTPVEVWKPRPTLERMADCDGIEAVSHQLYIRDDTGEAPVWIVGFDPETDFVIRPWIVGNREASLPDGAVWAGCKVNANADGCVKLFGQAWPTAARLDETGSGLDQAVFVNLSTLSDMIEASGAEKYAGIDPRTDYSATLIRIKSTADIDSVTHWLNTYLRKTKAVRSEATLTDTAAGIRGQIRLVAVITGAAWIVLLLALAIAQSMMMRERRKELFVWHAIGASRGIVNRVMLLEAVAIYASGGLIGVLIAALWLGVNTTFMICVIALFIMIGCASTIYAVKKATQSMNSQMLLTV